jgi:Protein of unknown function (DUF2905)
VIPQLGRTLIIAGLVIAAVGMLLVISGKVGWLGRLPGDITVRRGNFTFYFPLATCVVVSILLSLLFWFFRK